MEREPTPSAEPSATRAGFVTLVGVPNVGKSTLLNALTGERLSIVTERPQTTWRRVTGIRSDHRSQMIFLDTPGLLEPRNLLHRSLMMEARKALIDGDVLVPVLDAAEPLDVSRRSILQDLLKDLNVPVVPVVNKVDRADGERVRREIEWAAELSAIPAMKVSALSGEGTAELLEVIYEHLPESPFFYPSDEIATSPVRFFVSELVRETIFENFHEEIPYATFCEVEEFRDGGRRTYIQVNIYVERPSQKGILIGQRGMAIQNVGRRSREKIEEFLGTPVYLDLWVKVLPRWRKKRGELRRLGLPVPDHHD